MRKMTYQEAFETLRQAGFAKPAINRLYHLRQTYGTSEMDQAPLDVRKLEFIRWLVTTERLTEGLPCDVGKLQPSIRHAPETPASFRPSRFPFLFF